MFVNGFMLLLASSFVFGSCTNILQGTVDFTKLSNIFKENIQSKDVSSMYYAVKGYKLLNMKLPNLCKDVENVKYDINNIEQVFYLTNTAAYTSCQNSLKPEILKATVDTLEKKDISMSEIYYAVYTLKALGKGSIYDTEDALKNLIQLLKKDDSVANYGYTFMMCEHMGCGKWTATHVEGVLLQADETDGRALHWEGGLPVTATLLTTILRTYKTLNKPSPLTEEQSYKFAEYLLSRRSVNTAKGACLLLEAAMGLADDQKVSPVSIVVKGKKYITSEVDTIDIAVTDLIGRAVRNLKPEDVVAQSGTRLADDVVVLSKQPLTPKPNEPTVYTLDLQKIKSQYGLYKIALSAGTKVASVSVAVLGEIQVPSVEVGVGDIDGTTSPKTTTVAYPKSLSERVQADHLQRVFLKFSIRDKANKAVTVQQAFVRIGNSNLPDEIIFVAEPDNTKTYKVELNVNVISKHFNHKSGVYSVNLYLGDNAVANPINWPVGEISFNFAKDATISERGAVTSRTARPEIGHEFRVAEARPLRSVSDIFAGACAAPLLLLLVLWARLRVNLSGFPFTLSALVFHAGLGSILGLFVVFWLRLTMFDTVRYLLVLGLITFISGHRLLRHIASTKKSTN